MSFRPVNARSSQPGLGDNRPSVSVVSPSNTPRIIAVQHGANVLGPHPLQKQPSTLSDSQATVHSSNSTESSRVFTPTPPIIERSGSTGAASSGQVSSQESQLLQLSQLAAAQQKMPDVGARSSAKRTADGAVKAVRASPPGSPPRPSSHHSRNVSGVSVASTTSSRVTELSSELKTRLSYAMLKVHNGWQSRTIDEVETLTSRAASPASSSSTVAVRAASSASPKVRNPPRLTPPSSHPHPVSSRSTDEVVRGASASPRGPSPPAQPQGSPSLAPPVSIQPHRSDAHPRTTSDPKYTPNYLAPRSHHASPHTPAVSTLHITPNHRNLRAVADPMVTSPTHSKIEKEAMEALLFMSSPGNSANLKAYQPGSQPLSNLRNGTTSVPTTQRKALPTSAPKRKGLPNGRPTHSSQPLPTAHSPQKRVGFERSPTNPGDMMDLDEPASSHHNPASLVRMANGTYSSVKTARFSQAPSNESQLAYRKSGLDVEHLDKVLDRMAAEDSSSDSEGEIMLPVR